MVSVSARVGTPAKSWLFQAFLRAVLRRPPAADAGAWLHVSYAPTPHRKLEIETRDLSASSLKSANSPWRSENQMRS